METKQASPRWLMDKQMLPIQNGISFSYKTCKGWKCQAKWKKPDTKSQKLCDFIYMNHLEYTNSQRQKTD